MHRGSEKLFESRDYRQIMMLANRHDWLSAFSSELVIALVLEQATGITPPERATWARTLLAEANRVMATLAFLAAVVDRCRGPSGHVRRARAAGARAGGRHRRTRPSRCSRASGAWPRRSPSRPSTRTTTSFVSCRQLRRRSSDAVLAYAEELAGIAVLGSEDALGFGASGAVARASGLDLDLRRDDPYLAYAELHDLLTVPVRTGGDAPRPLRSARGAAADQHRR